jgi:uncharacterized protein YcbK (DUF882 family)
MRETKDPLYRPGAAGLGRRGFLLLGASVLGGVLTRPVLARTGAAGERRLRFHNTHTGEDACTAYWADGNYLADGLRAVNRILRDHRSGDIHPIDTGLLDLLYVLQDNVGSCKPYQVISGYRSPATNASLRRHSHGVARHSYHMRGMAIDIRLADCRLDRLHRAALALQAGGVGYYPRSDFIHVDVGPVRTW